MTTESPEQRPGTGITITEADFKDHVKAYVALHDQMCESSRAMKDIRKRKDALGGAILAFMKSNEIDELQMADGKLIRRQAKRVEALKKDHIVEELAKVCTDSVQAETMYTNICSKRQIEYRDALKRTRTRK